MGICPLVYGKYGVQRGDVLFLSAMGSPWPFQLGSELNVHLVPLGYEEKSGAWSGACTDIDEALMGPLELRQRKPPGQRA